MTLPPLPYPHGVVQGVGPREAKIALIGEQPALNEIRTGKPFKGPAGEELDKCLADAGIARSSTYITNVIKDMHLPLKSYINIPGGKALPSVSELGNQYLEYLKAELKYVSPNVVVALGNIPLYALTQRTGITKWRGSVIESTLIPGMKVIPTFHPSSILPKRASQGKYLNKHLITFDLVRTLKQSEFPEIVEPEVDIRIEPTFYMCIEFLAHCSERQIVDFDIEIVNEELHCISFATTHNGIPLSISIPFVKGVSYFPPDQEAEILLKIAEIIENPDIDKRGQNLSFDLWFMLRKYGIKPRGRIHDTMIAQKISLPDYPAGLDFITSMHTEFPYYKGEGKKWMNTGGPVEDFWTYNARDSIATLVAHPKQMQDLSKQGNIPGYDVRCKLLKPLIYMQERGIRIDVDGMLKGRSEVEDQKSQLEEELWSIVGYEINYNSPKQMMRYFYDEKGLKPYTRWNPGKQTHTPTCDDKALTRLARRGFKEANLVGKLRTLSTKHLGTYLSLDKIDPDGRYRSSYNPVGARTGRLSSGENIFGTGGNQQNWPDALLKYMIADEGYILYSLDLSQAENRIVAYIGKIWKLIDAFESGVDVHRLMASNIFGKPIDEISDEPNSSTLGDGTHSERFWGKKGNHAVNYDIGFKEFALVNELTERDSKQMLNTIHANFPEIRQGYHATIKAMLSENRMLTTPFGDTRLFMDKWPDGNRGDLFKAAYAHIPQSTVGRKINEQGINYIYYNQDKFGPIELLRQVHDDIGFQVPLNIGFRKHAEMLWAIKKSLETPLVWNDREFVIPADITCGFSFCKADSIEIKHSLFPGSISELETKLEEIHSTLMQKTS